MCGNLFCNPLWPLGCGMSHTSEPVQTHTHTESALDVLKKRYAHGEISKEEFEEKKKDIA